MAAFAQGETIIRNAEELRVKESDRIQTVTDNLSAMGADITAAPDGMSIRGGQPLTGASIRTCKDHRIAMSFAVAGMAVEGVTSLDDAQCVAISYPQFFDDLQRLS